MGGWGGRMTWMVAFGDACVVGAWSVVRGDLVGGGWFALRVVVVGRCGVCVPPFRSGLGGGGSVSGGWCG